jgi:probable rRNA maturation factor
VTVQDRQRWLRLDRVGLRRAAEIALAAERYRAGELALVFVDDRQIARLNARYLGHRGPTDVLAFGPVSRLQRGAPRWLGDIVISTQTAQRQAPHWRRRVGEELAEYVIHGVLHLAGYDDATAAGRRRMERRQEALLVRWRSARLTRSS